MTCTHPVHGLTKDHLEMLAFACRQEQLGLWDVPSPTVMGNNEAAQTIARTLGHALGGVMFHHSGDGCWVAHLSVRAYEWDRHHTDCEDQT